MWTMAVSLGPSVPSYVTGDVKNGRDDLIAGEKR